MCVVDADMIQVINRSPKYKNKYVHRKTSLSVSNLSSQEFDQRKKLGLIRTSVADAEYYRLKQEMIAEEQEEGQQQTTTAASQPTQSGGSSASTPTVSTSTAAAKKSQNIYPSF